MHDDRGEADGRDVFVHGVCHATSRRSVAAGVGNFGGSVDLYTEMTETREGYSTARVIALRLEAEETGITGMGASLGRTGF